MIFELDKYSLKARLYPSFLVLVPAFVCGIFYITNLQEYYHYLTAIFSLGLVTFFLAQLGRDRGKIKEVELNKYFGGKPSTQLLRHSNNYLDKNTKSRYHEMLSQIIPNIHLPSYQEEQNDSTDADQVYESCAKYLISKTRDTKKYNLLFKENINYGFRRNLWGMKSWALLIVFISIVIHTFYATQKFSIPLNTISSSDFFLFIFFIASALFWIFIIRKDWVKIPSFAYAERLYESLNDL